MTFRAFVAVPVGPDAALTELLGRLAATRGDVKVVDPEHLHLTLSFLGDVPETTVPDLARAIDEAVAGVPAFRAQMHGVGAFPNVRHPRVIWGGVEDPRPLVDLAERVRAQLAKTGREDRDKDFRAHVTFARVRSERDIEEVIGFLKENGSAPLPAVDIRDVRLFRSALTPQGPRYDVVHVAPLEA